MRYEKIILDQICCEKAPQVVRAWTYIYMCFLPCLTTRPGTRTFLQVLDPSNLEVKNPYP